MSDCVFSGSKGSEEVCEAGTAAAGGIGAAAAEDGVGGPVFTGPVGRGQRQTGAEAARCHRFTFAHRR